MDTLNATYEERKEIAKKTCIVIGSDMPVDDIKSIELLHKSLWRAVENPANLFVASYAWTFNIPELVDKGIIQLSTRNALYELGFREEKFRGESAAKIAFIGIPVIKAMEGYDRMIVLKPNEVILSKDFEYLYRVPMQGYSVIGHSEGRETPSNTNFYAMTTPGEKELIQATWDENPPWFRNRLCDRVIIMDLKKIREDLQGYKHNCTTFFEMCHRAVNDIRPTSFCDIFMDTGVILPNCVSQQEWDGDCRCLVSAYNQNVGGFKWVADRFLLK